MDSVPRKAFLLVQLLLLLSCFQEASCDFPHPPDHPPTWDHRHGHPPSLAPSLAPFHPPAYPPFKPPVNPPAHPPGKPPVYSSPWRKFIAVQGVVYCKSCKETLDGRDKPIFGAQVKLLCKNTKYSAAVATATTDRNGYFFLQAPKTVSSFASHRCKAYLASSPISSCSHPSNLNGGVTGATLRWEMWPSIKYPFILYSVGPFAFEPKCKGPGPK